MMNLPRIRIALLISTLLPCCFPAASFSQTNTHAPIVFERLLSTNNSVLMTNAEFRQVFGRKLVFAGEGGSKAFEFNLLQPSVLERLKLDAGKLAAKPTEDEQRKTAAESRQAQTLQQQKLAEEKLRQPQRPDRAPVDLSDTNACLYELAALATFPMYTGGFEDGVGMGLFIWADPVDDKATARIMDTSARLDHLAASPDPEFRKQVAEVSGILTDIWRVYRARQEFHYVKKVQYTDAMEKGAIMRDAFNHAIRDNHETTLDARGNQHTTYYGPTPEQLEADARNEDTVSQAQAYRRDFEMYKRTQDLAEALAFDELGAFWERTLLPRLTAAPRGASAVPLLKSDQTTLTDAAGSPMLWLSIGAIFLDNISGQTLSNLVVKIEQPAWFGEVQRWYGFLPALPPTYGFMTVPMGSKSIVIRNSGTQGTATVLAMSSLGRQPAFRARDCAEGHVEDVRGFGNAHVSYGVVEAHPWSPTYPKELAEMTDVHDLAAQEVQALLPAAKNMREQLRRDFPALPNPVTARAKLLAAFSRRSEYRLSTPENDDMAAESIKWGTVESNGVVTMTVIAQMKAAAGEAPDVQELELTGRLCEDNESGCVAAFILPSQLESLGGKTALERRLIWLRTSAIDVFNFNEDRERAEERIKEQVASTAAHPGTQQWSYWRQLGQQYRRTVVAPCVIFLDENGRPYIRNTEEDGEVITSRLE